MRTIKKYDESVKEVISDFKFEKAKKIMDVLQWKWVNTNNTIPSISEMVLKVISMFDKLKSEYLAETEEFSISTGGFTVGFFENDFKEVELYIRFSIENSTIT